MLAPDDEVEIAVPVRTLHRSVLGDVAWAYALVLEPRMSDPNYLLRLGFTEASGGSMIGVMPSHFRTYPICPM